MASLKFTGDPPFSYLRILNDLELWSEKTKKVRGSMPVCGLPRRLRIRPTVDVDGGAANVSKQASLGRGYGHGFARQKAG
jgi:hypothetical protein